MVVIMSQIVSNRRKQQREESERENRVVAPLRQADTIPDRGEEDAEEGEEPKTLVRRKTSRERVRKFRLRKKLGALTAATSVHDGMEAGETSVRRKNSTERVREFRKRKKLKAQQEVDLDQGGSDAVGNDAAAFKRMPVLVQPNTNRDPAQNLEPMPGGSRDPVRFYPRPDPVQIPARAREGPSRADSGTNFGEFF